MFCVVPALREVTYLNATAKSNGIIESYAFDDCRVLNDLARFWLLSACLFRSRLKWNHSLYAYKFGFQ